MLKMGPGVLPYSVTIFLQIHCLTGFLTCFSADLTTFFVMHSQTNQFPLIQTKLILLIFPSVIHVYNLQGVNPYICSQCTKTLLSSVLSQLGFLTLQTKSSLETIFNLHATELLSCSARGISI